MIPQVKNKDKKRPLLTEEEPSVPEYKTMLSQLLKLYCR